MPKSFKYVCIAMSIILNISQINSGQACPPAPDEPVPVKSVDLKRYVGRWYEIAKIPNRFQRKCSRGTTAQYALLPDGRIEVINRCIKKDGETITARGVAKVVDLQSNARLKVSFVKLLGFNLFWGDYWIIGLDENYEFAIVGTPGRKYGWILSRSPQMSPAKLEQAWQILKQQGYRPEDFVMTPQTTGK